MHPTLRRSIHLLPLASLVALALATPAVAAEVRFAYYPGRRAIEVAVERTAPAADAARTLTVRVIDEADGRVATRGELPVDAEGNAQGMLPLPDLPDGVYRVECEQAGTITAAKQTFTRQRFPFETERHGLTHEVFPPFVPVTVDGATVSVVGRSYVMNACGCDQVTSLGKPLLAAPIRLVGETDSGPIAWRDGKIAVRTTNDDEAVFEGSIASDAIAVSSRGWVQEDGCVRVEFTLAAGPRPAPVKSLRLEIPMREEAARGFHFIGDNSMRFNYAGPTPRGRTTWYREPWDHWVPVRVRTEPGPSDGEVWNSSNVEQYKNGERADHRPSVPYLWLGTEERGLAWFADNEAGCVTEFTRPLQRVIRRRDAVVVEIDLVQTPFTFEKPRTIAFGLMASPGKPMGPSFRTRPVAHGIGPVSCWGGWLCASKYPTDGDFEIVDKIQEARRTGTVDKAWFEERAKRVAEAWPGRKINGGADWLGLTLHFAGLAAGSKNAAAGTYFEEHATDPLTQEWQVFQDEWSALRFHRFAGRDSPQGVFAESYQDFALWYANEWMKRGVSLYFDNAYPKRCYQPTGGAAFFDDAGKLRYGTTMFAQRAYYRRIWKLAQEWNRRGAPWPIDVTLHMTNTQTLPFNTWATATLDLEQLAHTADPAAGPPEVATQKGGFQLPWPPDYTRIVTAGRQVGAVPLALDFVSGQLRHDCAGYTPAMMLREWGMCRVHDVRCSTHLDWVGSAALARKHDAAMREFGYGRADVAHHNYWAENTPVHVADPRVKSLALIHKDGDAPAGMLLLQSYERAEGVACDVRFPHATSFTDIDTGEEIKATDGVAKITVPAPFGTRLFRVAIAHP
jgi:hypothetical protein